MAENEPLTVSGLLKKYTNRFADCDFESPSVEAAFIISEVTSLKHNSLTYYGKRILTSDELKKADEFLKRRLTHEPYQYIFGHAEFRWLDLDVGKGCLIPRCETELIVDMIKKRLKMYASVCELGTGSGAISLALASERPDVYVFGVEYSEKAYYWSMRNLEKTALKNVSFSMGDLFSPFIGKDIKFDCVVGNLPYISFDEKDDLPDNVRLYEPSEALFANDDGLEIMKKALTDAPSYLTDNGFIIFEIGENQGDTLKIFARQFFNDVSVLKDQYNVERFLLCQFKR